MKFSKVNLIATLSLSSMLLMGCCSGSTTEANITDIDANTSSIVIAEDRNSDIDANTTSIVIAEDSNITLDNTTIPPTVDISGIKIPPSIPSE